MKFGDCLFYSSLTILMVLAIPSLVPKSLLPEGQLEQATRFEIPEGANAGDLFLEPCTYTAIADNVEYQAECGILVVPENRKDANSRLIALPVTRIPATAGAALEPIFWLEGGPGGPNELGYPSDGLFTKHDFVMVGYRAIEGQVVLDCPEVGDAIRENIGDFLSDQALASYGDGAASCGAKLQADGVDLAGYSMNQTIDDVEAARVALGYERINLFGNSYGTRLEMLYQWRYPNSLHRVVMVGVNPPGHFFWHPEDTEDLLGQYADLCAKDTHCSTRTVDLIATMREVSARMPTRWMGIPIDPDVVRLITFISLMESMHTPNMAIPLTGPAAIDMWLDAAEGDASGMALASLLSSFMLPEMQEWGHFMAIGASAQDYLDPDRDYRAELNQSDAIVGAPLSRFLLGLVEGWPASNDQSSATVSDSDVETLLISGALDGSTPMQYARDELMPHLSNGHHVVLEAQGHTETFWNTQARARTHLLNTYFDTGVVDDSLYQHRPLVFDVNKSWGEMAKVLLTAALFAFGILALLTVLVIRKIRKFHLEKQGRSDELEYSVS
jgi:pimeloyl-ACP methyl ester carboxylesterase